MKVIILSLLIVGLLVSLPSNIIAGGVVFKWDSYTDTLTEDGGFRIYRRTVNGSYDYSNPLHILNDPTASESPMITIPNENAYFVLRAFDMNGGANNDEFIESANSNEVFYTPPLGDTVRFIWVDKSKYYAALSSIPERVPFKRMYGRTVTGEMYVYVTPPDGITSVAFYVDDPLMASAPLSTESVVPFDLSGGTAELANPYDTTTLANGDHAITLKITRTDAVVEVVHVPFTVYNP